MPNPPTRSKPATIAHTIWSWPWNRHNPLRAVLYARALGLTAETEDDGGWLLRYHLITVTGHHRVVNRYERTLRYLRRGGPSARPPSELLAKLRPTQPPASTERGTHAGS